MLPIKDSTGMASADFAQGKKLIDGIMKEHFTAKEISDFKAGGITVEIKALPPDIAGQSMGNKIFLDPETVTRADGVTEDVVVHELVHAFNRFRENKNPSIYTRRESTMEGAADVQNDIEIEEAVTEAITTSRLAKFDEKSNKPIAVKKGDLIKRYNAKEIKSSPPIHELPTPKHEIGWSNPQLGRISWTHALDTEFNLYSGVNPENDDYPAGVRRNADGTLPRITSPTWIPIVTDENVKVGGGATLKSGQVGFSKSQFQFARSYGEGKFKTRYVSRKAGDGLVIWHSKDLAKRSAAAARERGYMIRTVPVANGYVNLAARRKHYPNWHPNWSQSNQNILEKEGIVRYKRPQTDEEKRLNIEPDVVKGQSNMHPRSLREYWRLKNAKQ